MSNYLKYLPILKTNSLRAVLFDQDLAQLGDFLVNFIYSSVRVGLNGVSGGIHVWDYSLKNAIELANLRSVLGKKTKPDKVADAGEALIAYAYYSKLFNIEEMIEFLNSHFDNSNLNKRSEEKASCALVLSKLFVEIVNKSIKEGRFNDFSYD